jgi:uncharacterized protein (DUF2236 family)
VFFWAHATISEVVVKLVDVFDHPLGKAEKDQLCAESVRIWHNDGMSGRPVPPNRAALDEYFVDVYVNRLEKDPAVTEFIRLSRDPAAWRSPGYRDPAGVGRADCDEADVVARRRPARTGAREVLGLS